MRVLVTGGSGFIGAEVVSRLLARGDHVVVLRRARESAAVDRLACFSSSRLEVVTGDITDPLALARASRGATVVHHLAFLYRKAWQLGEQLLGPNLDATARVLKAAADAGARRIVLSSSVSVYGWTHRRWRWPLGENTPLRGWGTYPETKIRTEALVRERCQRDGMVPALLRLPHVYGPGASTFERFIEGMLYGRGRRAEAADLDPTLECGRLWHWVHVRDAADAIVAAGVTSPLAHDAFNIAGDTAVTRATLRLLVRALAAGPGRHGEVARVVPQFWMYDIRRAKHELGLVPRVRLVDGVREVVRRMWRTSAAA